jgi:hypothetical protein
MIMTENSKGFLSCSAVGARKTQFLMAFSFPITLCTVSVMTLDELGVDSLPV